MEKVETDRKSGIEMCMCPACIGKIIPFHLFLPRFFWEENCYHLHSKGEMINSNSLMTEI